MTLYIIVNQNQPVNKNLVSNSNSTRTEAIQAIYEQIPKQFTDILQQGKPIYLTEMSLESSAVFFQEEALEVATVDMSTMVSIQLLLQISKVIKNRYFYPSCLSSLQLNQLMSSKSTKWSLQEQIMLRKLKEEQDPSNQINWEKIAKTLKYCSMSNKSSKQCRQRYMNYLKFGGKDALSFDWTPEQIEKLISLYLEHGSSWIIISQQFTNKSENSIKNKFNNSIRKVSNILHELQAAESAVSKRRGITSQLLISMMDLVNQLQKKILQTGCTINEQSKVFKFRRMLLQHCFKPESMEKNDTLELIKLIKVINMRLRCFGVFKVKNRKQWKISDKSIESILEFDRVVVEQKNQYNENKMASHQNEIITPSELHDNSLNFEEKVDHELESLLFQEDKQRYDRPIKTLQEQVGGLLEQLILPTIYDYIF